MATDAVREPAPAKINLCLHVTGRRADGYHLLDSLVAFAGVGDVVTAAPNPGLVLSVTGPEADGLAQGNDNLVIRAARAMGGAARLTLWKVLPVASGLGGGSADAAATLRALSRLSGRSLPDAATVLALGADVPVCLAGTPARMRGIGQDLLPLPPLPLLWAVLINPRQAVATPAVFARLSRRDTPPVPAFPPKGWATAADLAQWLGQFTRNDLEAPATEIAPVIAQVLSTLSAVDGCLLARMSGSGATCFGLFALATGAKAAAERLRAQHPDWWICDTAIQDGK